MTMYDEGMMDEGAASLRDRDMIAGKRGGPSVRVRVRSVLSFFPGEAGALVPRVFRSPLPRECSTRAYERILESTPLSLL